MSSDHCSEPEDATRWSRADLALARRAARQRWGVPDQLRTEALYQCAKILTDPEAGRKAKLAATRLLSMLDRLDQLDDKLDLERSKLDKPEEVDARSALLDEALKIIRETHS